MSAKIQKKYSVSAAGTLKIENDGIISILNEETGELFALDELLSDFADKEVKLGCNYAEDVE